MQHFATYGIYKLKGPAWLYQSSLPLQTRDSMDAISSKYKTIINDIVSLQSCSFAECGNQKSKLPPGHWITSPNSLKNCQYGNEKPSTRDCEGGICKCVGDGCTIEDSIWEGKELHPTQYPNSVMYALNADLDMFEFMKTLLTSDNKVINIVIPDFSPGDDRTWFLLLYYGLFSSYYDRKTLIHCWGGYGRTGWVTTFNILLDDLLKHGESSFWYRYIIRQEGHTANTLVSHVLDVYEQLTDIPF